MPPEETKTATAQAERKAEAPVRAAQPVQMLGCVSRNYPLRSVETAGASFAVELEEEPGSSAVVRRYATAAERQTMILEWARRWKPGSSDPSKASTVYISGFTLSAWFLPDGSAAYAIYPDNAASGMLCLNRADGNRLPEAISVLNNWCMHRLGSPQL